MILLSLLLAEEAALYDPAPPPDSAFVRVVNATPGSAPIEVVVNGLSLSSVGYQQATHYAVVKGGERSLSAGPTTAELSFDSGAFYTVVLEGGTLSALSDTPNDNLAKARLTLYNLSDAPVSLKTADGQVAVLEGVSPNGVEGRAVNAIPIELAVFSGDQSITLPKVTLAQGNSYSIFVTGTDPVAAALVRDTTRTN